MAAYEVNRVNSTAQLSLYIIGQQGCLRLQEVHFDETTATNQRQAFQLLTQFPALFLASQSFSDAFLDYPGCLIDFVLVFV